MELLGSMIVRNAGSTLEASLDELSGFCDAVVLVDDRSSDDTALIARQHPVVRAVTSMRSTGVDHDWVIPEGELLDELYRLAEAQSPRWLIRIDDDEHLDG